MAGGGRHIEANSVADAAEPPDDEAELVARAKRQPQAFGRLYDLFYSRILNYIYRRTLDVSLAEELTSNTFFHALRSLPGYDHRGKLAAWLYRIAGNEIRLHWRAARGRRQGDDHWREAAGRVRFTAQPATAAEEAEATEEKMRQFARLHDALARLPERYQAVLALRYFEGLSYEEVAEVLGKRLGTVKSLIHRGLARLKNRLENEERFERNSATFRPQLHSQVQKDHEP